MKIDNPLLSQVSANALQQSSGVQGAPGESGASRVRQDGHSDRVQLSNLGAALRDAAVEDPDRTAAVEAIRAAVESGTYRVDAAAVSRKIVEELRVA